MLCRSLVCMHQQMGSWWALAASPFVRQQRDCCFLLGSLLTTTLLLSRQAPSSKGQGAYTRDLAVQTRLAVQTCAVLNG